MRDEIAAAGLTLCFVPTPRGGDESEVLINPVDLSSKGWDTGDFVTITGVARALGRLVGSDAVAKGKVAFHSPLATSIGAMPGDEIELAAARPVPADRIVFAVVERRHREEDGRSSFLARFFGHGKIDPPAALMKLDEKILGGRVLTVGSVLSHEQVSLRVIETVPDGAVVATRGSMISVIDPTTRGTSFSDVGGLSAEVARIREMVELPLRHPELFTHLGVEAPRGLLLYGPPGCGKTLIARAVAEQVEAFFITINGPEIIQKHYGESEELLRKVFEEAQKHPATILFIDEIDALAPNRETVLGEVEKRVVGQLLALMDGVTARGKVVVMAATNLPNNVDPALRRPGRFDREIAINPPTKAGRREILDIHTRFMPLAADVDLDRVASVTHGFLGADLAALCREAGTVCARDWNGHGSPAALFVRMKHFQKALSDFRLSTMREMSSDIAETHWEDIGGLDEPKRLLREAIDWPLRYAPRFKHAGASAPKGVLLTGSSGVGKTMLAQAIGTTTDVNFIVARGPELLSKWVGESERGIREVFRRARQSAPSIIFFDEIDAIVPARGNSVGDGQVGDRMVGQFLLEFDHLDQASTVVVLAATNRPDLVDQALLRPGRFDLVINLPKPDRKTRLAILKVQCRRSPLSEGVDLDLLADLTDGMTGADLEALCQHARMLAIGASVRAQPDREFMPFAVLPDHFDEALAEIRHSKLFGRRYGSPESGDPVG